MKAILSKNALLLCLLLPFAASAQEPIDESRSVSANERISIEVMRGTVRIRPSDDNVFRVRGTIDEDAEGYTLESENGFTSFEIDYPRSSRGRSWSDGDDGSELEIEIPQGSELEFEGVSVDVDVMGITGGSEISTVNGDIIASELGNFVHLAAVNGEIDSRNNSGRIDISTINGEIRANSSATEVSISTVNGEADFRLSGTQVLELSTVNGDIDVRLADSLSPRIDGSTVSGDLRLALEPAISASFDISANSGGDIENDFSDERPTRDRYGPRKHLNFSTGTGAGSVNITTISGDIELVPL